jgi:hypothetical protein
MLDVLVVLVEAWEAKHFPLDLPTPITGTGHEQLFAITAVVAASARRPID